MALTTSDCVLVAFAIGQIQGRREVPSEVSDRAAVRRDKPGRTDGGRRKHGLQNYGLSSSVMAPFTSGLWCSNQVASEAEAAFRANKDAALEGIEAVCREAGGSRRRDCHLMAPPLHLY